MKLMNELNNNKPTILYLLTDERYGQLFAGLDYRFIVYQCDGANKWANKYGNPPSNHIVTNNITPNIIPDIVFCFDKVKHYNVCKEISEKYGTSLILYEDTVYSEKEYDLLTKQAYSNVVCTSKEHAGLWGFKKFSILPFAPVTKQSKVNHDVYVHASVDFSSTGVLLDKMSEGRCVIAPAVWENLKIINNGVNGYLYNPSDSGSVKKIFEKLNSNEDLREIVGLNAKETVDQKYNYSQFKSAFDKLIAEYK